MRPPERLSAMSPPLHASLAASVPIAAGCRGAGCAEPVVARISGAGWALGSSRAAWISGVKGVKGVKGAGCALGSSRTAWMSGAGCVPDRWLGMMGAMGAGRAASCDEDEDEGITGSEGSRGTRGTRGTRGSEGSRASLASLGDRFSLGDRESLASLGDLWAAGCCRRVRLARSPRSGLESESAARGRRLLAERDATASLDCSALRR